jgi:DnaJ-class molecular chaperone
MFKKTSPAPAPAATTPARAEKRRWLDNCDKCTGGGRYTSPGTWTRCANCDGTGQKWNLR